MKRASEYFYKQSNLISCLIFTALMVTYAAMVLGGISACFQSQLPEGMEVFGLTFGYTYEYANTFLGALNRGDLDCYRELVMVWDTIFPIFYATMYIFWISLIYKKTSIQYPQIRWINLFPLIPMLLDWVENIFELRMVNGFIDSGKLISSDVSLACLMTQLKWFGSSLNYLIILIGILMLVTRIAKERMSRLNTL